MNAVPDRETGAEPGDAYFGEDAEWTQRWRRLGARTKADHVIQLLAATTARPRTVLEVGCGDGALLDELAGRGVGEVRIGAEVNDAARRLAADKPGVSDALIYDGRNLPFEDRSQDLVICSHVLEHSDEPATLTRELIRVSAELVLIEVPLEDNLSARRPAAQALSRQAGHIQQFNRNSARGLLPADAEVLGELIDPLPREASTFWAGRWRGSAKWASRRVLHAAGLSQRLFTVHYALLARVS